MFQPFTPLEHQLYGGLIGPFQSLEFVEPLPMVAIERFIAEKRMRLLEASASLGRGTFLRGSSFLSRYDISRRGIVRGVGWALARWAAGGLPFDQTAVGHSAYSRDECAAQRNPGSAIGHSGWTSPDNLSTAFRLCRFCLDRWSSLSGHNRNCAGCSAPGFRIGGKNAPTSHPRPRRNHRLRGNYFDGSTAFPPDRLFENEIGGAVGTDRAARGESFRRCPNRISTPSHLWAARIENRISPPRSLRREFLRVGLVGAPTCLLKP